MHTYTQTHTYIYNIIYVRVCTNSDGCFYPRVYTLFYTFLSLSLSLSLSLFIFLLQVAVVIVIFFTHTQN